MLLRCLKAELQKCRRSPVWLAFVLLPVFPAVLGTGNFLANQAVLDNGWYSLWSQHTLFSSTFFLPALLGVFCAWQWRLEHTGRNWNTFLTAPVPVGDLYAAKLILAAGMSLLAQGCIGGLFLLCGKLAGVAGPVPPQLPGWLLFGALGGVSVCAVRLYLTTCVQGNYGTMLMGLMRMKDEQIVGKAAKEVAEVTLTVPRWAGMDEAFAPLAPAAREAFALVFPAGTEALERAFAQCGQAEA